MGGCVALPTDLELLKVEIDTLWLADDRGRLLREPQGRPAPHLVVAVANGGHFAAIGSEVPDDLAAELRAEVAGGRPSPPATRPASLQRCQRFLADAFGPVERSSGPSYVVPPGTAFASSAEVVRSNNFDARALRDRRPADSGWSVDEWGELLDGALGPWALAVIDARIVAICHCARLTDRGAEAGVWTDPRFRGQGHAAAVTAAWAALLAPGVRHLFYSTSAGNVSSQRVAARLHLRPIGWLWQLAAPSQT